MELTVDMGQLTRKGKGQWAKGKVMGLRDGSATKLILLLLLLCVSSFTSPKSSPAGEDFKSSSFIHKVKVLLRDGSAIKLHTTFVGDFMRYVLSCKINCGKQFRSTEDD